MLEFVAIGPNTDQRWRRPLPEGQVIRLGRAPLKGWSVPWDLRISREHVDLELIGERLEVRCLETARNPAYRLGEPVRQFTLTAGEDFRIGGTTFRLDRATADVSTPEAAPPAAPQASSDVELLKSQVAALQAQLAAQSQSRHSEPARSHADAEVEQLRAQVEALKSQMTSRRPQDERDRQIAELKAQLAALQSGGEALPAADDVNRAASARQGDADRGASAASSAPERPPSQQPSPLEPASEPERRAEAEPAPRASRRPDVEALKARIEAQSAAKRQTRQEVGDDPYRDSQHQAAAHAPFGERSAPPAAGEPVPIQPVPIQPVSDQPPSHERLPHGSLPGGARKSTLFVLKAQIEAQAAKLRRAGKKASAQQGSDTKRSDVEALKALLEARAAERAQARQSPGDKARGDASIRGSHIAALWALHDARAAAREAAARDEAIRAEADRSSYSDSSDDTDEPVAIEAVDDESDATEAWSPTLPERVWKALPADVQEVVREIAAGFVVDEAIKNRLAAALNRLIVSREFLNDAELEAELNAGQPATARKQWSEAELRSAARRALAKVLPGLAAARSPTAVRDVSRLVRGQCFGLAEVLTGRAHGATYIACPSLQGGPLPVELVRIDGGTLAKLRESSAEFQAACRQFSG